MPPIKKQKSKTSKKSYKPKLKRRIVDFGFPQSISKHWLANSAFKTHILNSFTLIFPEGEKYFLRSTKKYLDQIQDPKLKNDTKAFMAQESQHFHQHEQFFNNLKQQGYKIDWFLSFVRFVAKHIIENMMSNKMNLATTAGLEHYTALLAEIGLEQEFFKQAEPEMRNLFEWHAAEEIEHKAVAYDILQNVDDNYRLRLQGLAMATIVLFGFSAISTFDLIRQDKLLFNQTVWKDFVEVWITKEKLFFKSASIILRYIDFNYHPWQKNNYYLAKKVFSRLNKKRLIKQNHLS